VEEVQGDDRRHRGCGLKPDLTRDSGWESGVRKNYEHGRRIAGSSISESAVLSSRCLGRRPRKRRRHPITFGCAMRLIHRENRRRSRTTGRSNRDCCGLDVGCGGRPRGVPPNAETLARASRGGPAAMPETTPATAPSTPRVHPAKPSSQRRTPRQVRALPIPPGAAGDRPERNREAAPSRSPPPSGSELVQLSYSLNCSTSLKAPLSIV
jgi:hypothetical protein